MTGGWHSHLERVGRWHERAVAANNLEDQSDFLFAFFESSFALRDWLVDTGTVGQRQLEDLFAGSVALRINRDIANQLKHHSIVRPSQEQPPALAREYAPERLSHAKSRLIVLSEGRTYDALELASECLRTWRDYTAGL